VVAGSAWSSDQGSGHPRRTHLSLLARQKLKTIELLRIDVTQSAHESFDALVARGKRELIDEILIDRLAVSLQANLLFDLLPMRLAQ
jgi:hypothetical protein